MNINNIYLYYERFTSPQSPNTYKPSDKINYKALKTPFYLSHHFCISDNAYKRYLEYRLLL